MPADRLAVARRAAEAGGAVALDAFRTDLDVELKSGKTDTVTRADRDAQRRARETIREAFDTDPIVGEESGARSDIPGSGPAWIIDPIDGTNNYVRGFQVWATVVAAVVDGEPRAAVTHLPALGDTLWAGREAPAQLNGSPTRVSDRADPDACHVGILLWWSLDNRDEYAAVCRETVTRFADIRRVGSSQGALAQVASGALDGAITTVTGPVWDTVAGVHLIRAAGGRVTDIHGEAWHPRADGLVVSNGLIHDELLAAAEAAV